jgi:type I restriction enzyme M protein
MNKKALTETDIRTKFITPAIEAAGWDRLTQIREEVHFTNGHTIVRLPKGVFAPYTGIKTNLLFFTKGRTTTEVWY